MSKRLNVFLVVIVMLPLLWIDAHGDITVATPCATCIISSATVTANQLIIGVGSRSVQSLGSLGTTTTVLHGNAAGASSFAAVTVADVSGALAAPSATAWIPAAGCNNVTAGNAWDLPTSNAPTAVCGGTSYRFGNLTYGDGANQTASFTVSLPTGWTGAVDISVSAYVNATSQSVKATIATTCVAANEDLLNPTFNSAQTVTVTSPGTANQLFFFTQTGVTMTGCAAGELWIVKIGRDVTDTSTADLLLTGAQVTIRVTPTV